MVSQWSILLVHILFHASFIIPACAVTPGFVTFSPSCFCGFGRRACRVDNGNNRIVPKNCTQCIRITGSLYNYYDDDDDSGGGGGRGVGGDDGGEGPQRAGDCRQLVSHCSDGRAAASSSSSSSHLCRNGGTCIQVLGSFYCSCPPQYFGIDCSIYDPNFKHIRLNEPIVYFPLQAETGRPRSVYIGVIDFGDEFTAQITFKTIGTQYTLTEFDFEWINVKAACRDRLSQSDGAEDPAMCDLLPPQDIWAAEIPHRTIQDLTATHKLEYLTIDGKRRIIGIVDKVEITLFNDKYKAFNHTYKLFTSISQHEILCNHYIEFSGCSTDRSDPLIYGKHHETIIKSIIKRSNKECRPINVGYRKWLLMTHLQLHEIERSNGLRGIRFESGELRGGMNEIQFEYKIYVDPPHYGTDKFMIFIGICWVYVFEGPLNLAISDGFLRTVPCNAGFTLEAINLNRNYRMEDMNFTWTCTFFSDHRCKKQHSHGSVTYPPNTVGCGQLYYFTMTVYHRASKLLIRRTTNVQFKRGIGGEFKLGCVKNCQPTAHLDRPTVIRAESRPWFPGRFKWSIVNSLGSPVGKDGVTLRETHLGDFLYFNITFNQLDRNGNFTLMALKGGAEAGFELIFRLRPQPPVCSVNNSKSAQNRYTYDIICEAKPGGTFTLIEIYGHEPTITSSVMWSSSGRFLNAELYFGPAISVFYSTVQGDGSSLYQPMKSNFDLKNDMMINGQYFTKLEGHIESGDFLKALRLLNTAARRLLVEKETEIPGIKGNSNVTKLILDYLFRVHFYASTDSIQTSLNLIIVLLMVQDDDVLTASYNRHKISVVLSVLLRTFMSTVNFDEKMELLWNFSEEILFGLNGLSLRAMLRVDPFLSTPVDWSNAQLVQKLKRLNEDASSNLIDYIKDIHRIYIPFTWPMGKNCLASFDSDNIHLYLYWSASGTTEYVTNEYFQFERQQQHIHVAIDKHESMNSGPYLNSSTVTLQVATFTVDIFWWHRTETFHTEIILTRLFDDRNKTQDAPPSNDPIGIKLKVLPKYYHLLDGTIINSSTTLPPPDDDDKELQVRRYSFKPPVGNNSLYYEFLHCGSKFGCRAVIMRHQPLTDEFPNRSETSGHFVTRRSVETPSVYYLGVLPDSKEEPGKVINFTLRITTGTCKVWTDHQRMQSCEFVSFDGTNMIGSVKQLSWTGMTIHETKFSPVVNLQLHATRKLDINMYVMGVALFFTALFLLILLWSKFEEAKDAQKRYLLDVKEASLYQNFPYIIGVYTGTTVCHTTSSVGLRLVGDNIGPVCLIKAPRWPTLRSGTSDWFRMFTQERLGAIKELHLWHNNAGCCPNWYCDKVVVTSPTEPGILYEFQVKKWLSVTGSTEESQKTVTYAETHDSLEDSVRAHGKLLITTWKTELLNRHVLLRVFYKHPRTLQNRTELLVALWVHTFSAMVGSLLFWELYSTGEETEKNTIEWYEYIYGLLSTLACTYTSSAIVSFTFRTIFIKEKPERTQP